MVPRSEPRQVQQSPVRIFGVDGAGHAINVSAWTVDVSRHGARIKGVRDWSTPGDEVGVRHGMEKARFKVVWVGADGTPRQGEIGLLCVEAGKYIWGISAPTSEKAPAPGQGKSVTSMFRLGDQVRAAIGLAPGAPLANNNRRKDARYKASGGAKVQQVGAPAGQWVTLHDLSLGGCYVETSDPLPPTTEVELMLHIGDIQIAAKGVVTVSHRLVGMGLRFTDVSSLNRKRLEQVMATLIQTSSEA